MGFTTTIYDNNEQQVELEIQGQGTTQNQIARRAFFWANGLSPAHAGS
jgi:hypothetical protein